MAKTRFEMLIDDEERVRWYEAARADGRSLAAWLRRVANEAAGESATEPEPAPVVEHVKLSDLPPVPKPRGKRVCARCVRVNRGVSLPGCVACKEGDGG